MSLFTPFPTPTRCALEMPPSVTRQPIFMHLAGSKIIFLNLKQCSLKFGATETRHRLRCNHWLSFALHLGLHTSHVTARNITNLPETKGKHTLVTCSPLLVTWQLHEHCLDKEGNKDRNLRGTRTRSFPSWRKVQGTGEATAVIQWSGRSSSKKVKTERKVSECDSLSGSLTLTRNSVRRDCLSHDIPLIASHFHSWLCNSWETRDEAAKWWLWQQ